MKNFISIILTTVALTLICAVSAGLLALTNELTAEKIAQAEVKAQNEAMQRIIVADTFEQTQKQENVYHVAKNGNGEVLGYIFTFSENGYGGAVKVMTGIAPDGKIIAIEVLSAGDETPGLGQNATKSDFWKLFEGKSGQLKTSKSASTDSDIQAMTGATITSRAVVNAVNKATALFEIVIKEAEQ